MSLLTENGVPDECKSVKKVAVESKSDENVPAECKSIKNVPAESKSAENVPAESKSTENVPAGSESTENVPAECKTVEKISCSSQVLIEHYTYTWRMNNFGRIPFLPRYPIYSPNFALGKRSDSLWQVVVTKHVHCPKDKKPEDDDDSEGEGEEEISESSSAKPGEQPKESVDESEKIMRFGFRLAKLDETSTWEVVKYYFTLKGSNGTECKTEVLEEPGSTEYEGKTNYAYITENDPNAIGLFTESDITLVADITFKYIEGSPFEAPEVCESKSCADDLRLLYNSKKFSDVILVVEGAEIAAHKSILCARAYAFESLLTDYKDTAKQKVDLRVDEEVGRALVSFMYCGGIKKDFPVSKCLDLYEAAQTYGVSNLKKLCSKYFKKHLQKEVCRKCLGIDENVEDCLDVVRRLGSKRVKRIVSQLDTCSHKAAEEQKS